MTQFICGVDLGQTRDYTAIVILEKSIAKGNQATYKIRYLERPILGTPYPKIIERVSSMMKSNYLKGRSALVIDQTGCGRPVFDQFKQAGLDPAGISIHGGDSVSHEGRSWRVPKRDLVAVLQVLLQNDRLQISKRLALGDVLTAELLNFRVKINPETASDSYSAWREHEHDDLVLATALGAWYGENMPKPLPPLTIPRGEPCTPGWQIGSYQ